MPYIECVYEKEVTHIGFLDGMNNRRPSLDGPGISVTTHPSSWRAIMRLNSPELKLSFSAAQWVDAMTFSDVDLHEMQAWALREGYLRHTNAWFTLVEEGHDIFPKAFPTREEAAAASDRSLAVEEEAAARGEGATWPEETFCLTSRGMTLLERWPGSHEQWEQAVILLYVRMVIVPKRPWVVGIWWSEPDSVEAGCAPSGILFPERLHIFDVENEDGDRMAFRDMFPELDLPGDPLILSE